MATSLMLLTSCNNHSSENKEGTDSTAVKQTAATNDDIIENKEKNEVLIMKGKEFTEEQKKYLQSINAPPLDVLNALKNAVDTVDVIDSTITRHIIIKKRFGTY